MMEALPTLSRVLGSAAAAKARLRGLASLAECSYSHTQRGWRPPSQPPAPIRQAAVLRNTLLLGTSASTIEGAFEALAHIFGRQRALEMAERHPGLLRSLPATLHGSWGLLQTILESAEDAEAAVRQNSALLKARPSTMRGAWEALRSIWGNEAQAAVRAQLGLLRTRPGTILEALEA